MYTLNKITYEFLEPYGLESPTVCIITAHLDNSFKLNYRLVGREVNPDCMTTDRLYELLSNYFTVNKIINFHSILDDFVVDFILRIRNKENLL